MNMCVKGALSKKGKRKTITKFNCGFEEKKRRARRQTVTMQWDESRQCVLYNINPSRGRKSASLHHIDKTCLISIKKTFTGGAN